MYIHTLFNVVIYKRNADYDIRKGESVQLNSPSWTTVYLTIRLYVSVLCQFILCQLRNSLWVLKQFIEQCLFVYRIIATKPDFRIHK